jgi:hypothetical protein
VYIAAQDRAGLARLLGYWFGFLARRIDNSYTSSYSLYIYCVFAERGKPCVTPLSIYGHCPLSET